MKFTTIYSEQTHTEIPHHFMTHISHSIISSRDIFCTHTREAVLENPGAQSISISSGDEPRINCTASNPVIIHCAASEPETFSSLDIEPVVVNDCTSNAVVVISSASKPETVNSGCGSVLKSCDCSKPLVMNNFNGNLACINSKSVMDSIPNKE
jgi:hypothetical protein